MKDMCGKQEVERISDFIIPILHYRAGFKVSYA
jgi:hypothetical protein